jgi:hypothetical protein
MEDKLQNLRGAMDRTVFKESHFSNAERKKIRAAVIAHEQTIKRVWFPKLASAVLLVIILFFGMDLVKNQFNSETDGKTAKVENTVKQDGNKVIDQKGEMTRWTGHPEDTVKGWFIGFGNTGTIIDDTKGFMLNSIVIYKSQFESFDEFIQAVRPIEGYRENNHIQGVIVYINYFEQEGMLPEEIREDVLELQRQAQYVDDAKNEKAAKEPSEVYNNLLQKLKN